MSRASRGEPDHTALRVALWRALHVLVDQKPSILEDDVGARLVGEANWRERQDMEPDFSKPMRASVVGRARFIEDLVGEQVGLGVDQYVILGAGLDSFSQRRPELMSKMRVFEIDQPGPQSWKKARLNECGLPIPKGLVFVPVDFEAAEPWWPRLTASGFDPARPAVVVSTGVSMYLSRESNTEVLRRLAKLAAGSTFAMTFMLRLELLEEKERALMSFVMARAQESRTPFLSLFEPSEISELARDAGFRDARTVPATELFTRYFAQRTDGLRAGDAEAFLLCRT